MNGGSFEKELFGWYLHNALYSECADRLIGVVARFLPWLQGREVIPRQPFSRRLHPSRSSPAQDDQVGLSLVEMQQIIAPFARRPSENHGITERNIASAAEVLGLIPLDRDLLQLALQISCSGSMNERLIESAWEQVSDLSRLAAALLGVSITDVQLRLAKSAPLLSCGLISVDESKFVTANDTISLPSRMLRLMRTAYSDAASWTEAVLGTPRHTTLKWGDFCHLHSEAEMAVRVLRTSARCGERGIHILLTGPPGTGKTELAKALASRARLRMFASAEQNEEQDDAEPSRKERFAMLRLGSTLLTRTRDAVLLLDEAEDVLEAPQSGASRRDSFSKAYLHRALEMMSVPIVWTCNGVGSMDRATLRRMTMVIEVPVPDVSVRTRIWSRVLAREKLRLEPNTALHLAKRWDASPGVAAGAARATRLSGGYEGAIECALKGVMTAMGAAPQLQKKTTDFDPALVMCNTDLRGLCRQLAHPDISRTWSLCLSGPPGSGKSEFVHYLADCIGIDVLQKRASDLLSMFVGGSEKAIAHAFREAQAKQSLLLIDEAESMLFDRGAALRSWEASQVNEMLTWMERHPLPFVCTTNMPYRMDAAVPRRFTLKLHFEALDRQRAELAFLRLLGAEAPAKLPEGLTPGDFAVVRRRALLFGNVSPSTLLAWLQEEAEAKTGRQREIGFSAQSLEPHPLHVQPRVPDRDAA